MTAKEYYKLKVRMIYRSYPVYVEGREPAGYIDSLKKKEPEVVFDPSKLRTKEDWIQAGKIVFEAENSFFPATLTPGGVKAPPAWAKWVSPDGIVQGFPPTGVYIIRKKGVIEMGSNSCAGCHTRMNPDGSFIGGAQGNFPYPQARWPPADTPPDRIKRVLDNAWQNFGTPWVQSRADFEQALKTALAPTIGLYPGVLTRQGTSATHPPHIPSLIGIADLKYLDATGLVRHRSVADLMRYAIINVGLDTTAHYGDFQPRTAQEASSFGGEEETRFSDEQLYALGLYLYSLTPPPNPNPVDDHSRRGQQVFQRQGCAGCHTPPFYTNNKLTPAQGFTWRSSRWT